LSSEGEVPADTWYYCDWEVDDERAFGPFTLEQLAELIRTGQVSFDFIVSREGTEDCLSFLAASPLEDLLSKDGPAFIDRVEQRAAVNPKFRRALGMLKRLGMTDDVWRRVQAAKPADAGRASSARK